MTVDQIQKTQNPDTEATLSIHFTSPTAKQTSSSATSSPASTDSTTTHTHPSDHDPTERVETIDVKYRTNSEILQELIRVTNAHPIAPTAEEKEEMQVLEEQAVRSERDRTMLAEHRARVKREKELFEQGRNDLAAQTA
jgi:large subunit ribosomal protein MRP49